MKLSSPKTPLTQSLLWVLVSGIFPGSVQFFKSKGKDRKAVYITAGFWAIFIIFILCSLFKATSVLSLLMVQPGNYIAVAFLILAALYWAFMQYKTLSLLELKKVKDPVKQFMVLLSALLVTIVSSGIFAKAAVSLKSSPSVVHQVFSDTGTVISPVNGRYNFVLLAEHNGDDTAKLDSIMVLSVDANTGQTAAISVPHNLLNAPIPDSSPLHSLYPDGYNCGADCTLDNLYPTIKEKNANLYPGKSDAGAEAMKDALSATLGIKVQSYLLMNTDGFKDFVNHVGGITLNLTEDFNTADNSISLKAGNSVHLDDSQTTAFASNVDYSNDFDRIARQRCVVSALVKQYSLPTLYSAFQQAVSDKGHILETDISASQLSDFNQLADKAKGHPLATMTLGPPTFPVEFPLNPDFKAVQDRVNQALVQASAQGKDQGVTAQTPAPNFSGQVEQGQEYQNTPDGAMALNQQLNYSSSSDNYGNKLSDGALCSVP